MNIIIGHTNMDMDCIASIVIACRLFPDHKAVKSSLIHPVAKNLYNMMKKNLNFLTINDLKNEPIENIIIVDTRSSQRIKEFSSLLEKATGSITVFDHHPSDSDDIPGAVINYRECGSNTTNLCSLLLENKIKLTSDEATIALAGIFADTGNFTHENTTDVDFAAASNLVLHGASIPLVKYFLRSIHEKHQINVFHELLNRLIYRNIHGHEIILSYMEIEDQVQGLAAVVENIFEVENQDAYFAVFYLNKKQETLIIARSQKESIDLSYLLSFYNGGGHKFASSAMIKKSDGNDIFNSLINLLDEKISSARTALDLMSKTVYTINENQKLLEASIFLEEINCTGAPVINDNGNLTGFLTLRDIMKGRKSQQMNAPVRAYMARNIVSVETSVTMKEIQKILYKNNIGHLPVVENNQLKGIITRTDILNHMNKHINANAV